MKMIFICLFNILYFNKVNTNWTSPECNIISKPCFINFKWFWYQKYILVLDIHNAKYIIIAPDPMCKFKMIHFD